MSNLLERLRVLQDSYGTDSPFVTATCGEAADEIERLRRCLRISDPIETFCPQCGLNVEIDEDGCCATCGATAIGDGVAEIARLTAEVERLKNGHCLDCCCARAWKALGITENTGRSIPEEIELRQAVVDAAQKADDAWFGGVDEIRNSMVTMRERLRALDGEP